MFGDPSSLLSTMGIPAGLPPQSAALMVSASHSTSQKYKRRNIKANKMHSFKSSHPVMKYFVV